MVETHPERWVDEHGDVLYRFALARVRDPAVAEDLVQETFLAALKGRERFAGESSVRSWLVGILKHKVMDGFRRKYRDQLFVAESDLEEATGRAFDTHDHWDGRGGQAPGSWGGSAAQDLERAEFQAVLDECLGKLPPKTAAAFALREMDDLGTAELCKVLNISATNLWVVLHRARTQLRRCLEMNWFSS